MESRVGQADNTTHRSEINFGVQKYRLQQWIEDFPCIEQCFHRIHNTGGSSERFEMAVVIKIGNRKIDNVA